jgi:hypothetical protein
LVLSFNGISEFIDTIIHKINKRSIKDFNTYVLGVQKKANEMIAKGSVKIATIGLNNLMLKFKSKGIDPISGSVSSDTFNEIMGEAVPDTIYSAREITGFVTDVTVFVKEECKVIDDEMFVSPLFSRLIILILVAFIVGLLPWGPQYIYKIIGLLAILIIIQNLFAYIPTYLDNAKHAISKKEADFEEEYKRLFP